MCVCHVPHGRSKPSTTAEDGYRNLRRMWWTGTLHLSLCWPDVTLWLIFHTFASLQTMTWTLGSPYNNSTPQQASQRDTDLQEDKLHHQCVHVSLQGFILFTTQFFIFKHLTFQISMIFHEAQMEITQKQISTLQFFIQPKGIWWFI